MGIEQLADLSPEIIEVEEDREPDLIETEAQFGSSMFNLHADYLTVNGGTPSPTQNEAATFDGGKPGTVFKVGLNFTNKIGS